MQSIIDKLSTPASFSQAIQEFLIVLQRAGDTSKHLSYLKTDFEYLSQIDFGNSDPQISSAEENSNWSSMVQILQSLKTVLQSLIEFNWQESKTNFFNKNSHHHHRSYDLSSTTFTSSTSCSSPMTVSPLGGSSTTSEYHLQPLHPPASQHNQVKYKVMLDISIEFVSIGGFSRFQCVGILFRNNRVHVVFIAHLLIRNLKWINIVQKIVILIMERCYLYRLQRVIFRRHHRQVHYRSLLQLMVGMFFDLFLHRFYPCGIHNNNNKINIFFKKSLNNIIISKYLHSID